METAAVSELNARLSHYLERVKAGEEIIITEHGEAIARVVPFTEGRPTATEFEELVRAGIIRTPKKSLRPDFWDRPHASDPEGAVRTALLEERDENR